MDYILSIRSLDFVAEADVSQAVTRSRVAVLHLRPPLATAFAQARGMYPDSAARLPTCERLHVHSNVRPRSCTLRKRSAGSDRCARSAVRNFAIPLEAEALQRLHDAVGRAGVWLRGAHPHPPGAASQRPALRSGVQIACRCRIQRAQMQVAGWRECEATHITRRGRVRSELRRPRLRRPRAEASQRIIGSGRRDRRIAFPAARAVPAPPPTRLRPDAPPGA